MGRRHNLLDIMQIILLLVSLLDFRYLFCDMQDSLRRNKHVI